MTNWLTKLKEIGEKATKGPWHWEYAMPGYLLGSYEAGEKHEIGCTIACVADGIVDEQDCNVAIGKPDRDFIALSRNLWPEIIAVVEAVDDVACTCDWDKGHSPSCQSLLDALAALRAKVEAP